MNKKTKLIVTASVAIFVIFGLLIGYCIIRANEKNRIQVLDINSGQSLGEENGIENTADGIALTAGVAKVIEDAHLDAIPMSEPATYWGYTNLGIANVSNHLNIRKEPNDQCDMVGKMSNGDACEILSISDNWAYVKSGKIEGYVCTDYLLTGIDAILKAKEIVTPVATINTGGVRVREEPNTNCRVITLLPEGEELKVLDTMDDWVLIDLDDEEAYVSLDYCKVEEKLTTAISMKELLYGHGVSDTRVDLCAYAKQFIGNPYVWGGTSLTNGCDCSGFTMKVYAHFGVSLPHYSRSQAQCGTTVSLDKVKPGDLIFYTRGGAINHVAIYIGDGQVCHASSPKTGIKVSGMYYRTPYKAVSLLP